MNTAKKLTLSFLILSLFTVSLIAQGTLNPQVISTPLSDSQSPRANNESKGIWEDLLAPILQSLTCISIISGVWYSVCQYRLKVKEEIRLSQAADAENDIKLLKLFSETVAIANGRNGHIISEKVIENLFAKDIITKNDFKDLNNLQNVVAKIDVAKMPIPVGQASQCAAITSIGILGTRYNILREPALAGLKNLLEQELNLNNRVQEAIDLINSVTSNQNN